MKIQHNTAYKHSCIHLNSHHPYCDGPSLDLKIFRRQILNSKADPRTERAKLFIMAIECGAYVRSEINVDIEHV